MGIKENTEFSQSEQMGLYPAFDFLIRAILHNDIRGIQMLDNSETGSLVNFPIGNQIVVLFYNPSGKKKLTNAFSEDMLKILCHFQYTDEPFPHSIYAMLVTESLAHGINLDPLKICESFDQFDLYLHEEAIYRTTLFCLMCKTAYDQSGESRLLDIALYIYDKYQLKPDASDSFEPFVLINRLQIRKRKGLQFGDVDIDRLYLHKKEAILADDFELLSCINVLLDNHVEAGISYRSLELEQKECIQTLPIFELYQMQISK
ncbi:hypothetical protein [Paenibacillus sp. 1_12]|uniref:hypothetical protein n=1 Tax=Paenibacillus sp. 1_12 TaxID=1566278 RepID=UPI001160461C|nr:hypothetical protein [Paenibacillus sp. 1_12]